MTDLAKYIRIFNADPDDDYATKRLAAIKTICDAYLKKREISDLASIGNALTSCVYDTVNLGSIVGDLTEKALKKQSSSFVAEGETLQMSVCALSAALQYIEGIKPTATTGLPTGTVLSISLWSGLSFANVSSTAPKLEQLRQDIVSAAQEIIFSRALTTRSRSAVSKPLEITVSPETNVQQLAATIQKAFSAFALPMRTNAALDREEIDVLWWVLNGWSTTLDSSFLSLNNSQRAIVAGYEITGLLRRLPSHVHRRLILKNLDSEFSLTSAELLEQLGDIVEELKTLFESNELIVNNPMIFPLATLIITGNVDGESHKVKRTLDEWCGRAIVEGTIMNISKFSDENL